MAQINLLDSQQKPTLRGRGFLLLSRAIMGVLAIALLFYGYLYFQQNSLQTRINQTRGRIAKAQNEAANNTSREELLTRQGQLISLNPLITNHVYWSVLLPEIARVTLTQSTYLSLEALSNGSMIVSVKLPTYADADKFLQVFDLPDYNRQFSNVRVLSINKSVDEGQISYVMRVQLNFNTDYIKNP